MDEQGRLFRHAAATDRAWMPLAERMRPRSLEEFVGQGHLVGPGKLVSALLESARAPSVVLWGPPGTGKTTLARLFAGAAGASFEALSATAAGVKDIRALAERAEHRRDYERRGTVVFIDELHRFNRGQQDALLPHVESGLCRLIGATTENPSFEVNAALLSRARVLRLEMLGVEDLAKLLRRAVEDPRGLAGAVSVSEELLRTIAECSDGDARRALGLLETAADLAGDAPVQEEHVQVASAGRALRYDRRGEEHYNVASALIKSLRASDADAGVYWLVRMLEAGEDPMFLARRLVIFASEDVGNADPQALVVAQAAAAATHLVGLPEASLHLVQAASYLALAPKSNAVLRAYAAARRDVTEYGSLEVPLELRNAPTKAMKAWGYGAGYRYPHDFTGSLEQGAASGLPERLRGRTYVEPGPHGWEADAVQRLRRARRGTGEGS